MKTIALAGALALLAATAATGATATAQEDPPDEPESGVVDALPGAEAVEVLDEQLDEIADEHDLTVPELTETLEEDETLWVDERGEVFAVEPAAGPLAAAEPPAAGPFPYVDTFHLHSRPSSKRTIYLDFDGHQIEDTVWYGDDAGPYTAEPYDADDSPGFSNSELDAIQGIWQRVAEDFAPLDVDVTTEAPQPEEIKRYGEADERYGTRVAITDSPAFDLNDISSTGVAYIGVFDTFGKVKTFDGPVPAHDYYQPAWAFPAGLGYDTKRVAEVVTHEAGHTLGLFHDGIFGNEYYFGHGIWAPIMGAGYDEPVVQWSRGEYRGATNTQDDFTAMRNHGARMLTDDQDGTTDTTIQLVDHATGMITPRSSLDTDVFGFVSPVTGVLTFRAKPSKVSPNLDIRLRAYDGTVTLLAEADPSAREETYDVAKGLSATVSIQVVENAVYYLQVAPTGHRTANRGYTTYGSVGPYRISVLGLPKTPGPPTDVEAAAGDAEATVTWSPPAEDPHWPITEYTATASPGGQTCTTATVLQCTVTGLTNGVAVSFTVTAANQAGTGPASAPSAQVIPGPPACAPCAPGAPTGVTAGLPGDGSLTVGWGSPSSDGGSEITGYAATASPGGATCTTPGNESDCVISGLDNGTPYTFRVRATNAVGTGPSSAASEPAAPLAPPTVPSAPRSLRVQSLDNRVALRWKPPADTGGALISEYRARCLPLGNEPGEHVTTSLEEVVIKHLRNGWSHKCTVRAVNAVGEGPWSEVAWAFPVGSPSAPRDLVAEPRSEGAHLEWRPPAQDGGLPISTYEITCDSFSLAPSVSGASGTTQATLHGLVHGETYRCRARADNGTSVGPWSSRVEVVPRR